MRSGFYLVALSLALPAAAQVLTTRPAKNAEPAATAHSAPPAPASVPLTVPAGTPLKVTLDQELRIKQVGQPVHGKIAEPVYAFDQLVVPAGAEVNGKVLNIGAISKKKRVLSALNADLAPRHAVSIEFDQLHLPDGRALPLKTLVSADSGGVLQFVSSPANSKTGTRAKARNAASRQIAELRQEVKRDWDTARNDIHQPGKVHKLERYAVAQLPYHPQYVDAGTAWNANLQAPLNFGSEMLRPDALSAIGTPPPAGSVVHAQLLTPLDSAHSHKGDQVEAVITQPLFASNRLYLPQGSRLKGSVLQVRPARRLGRNGQLRIMFHEVVPPDGLEQKIQASLEAVAVAEGEHLALDSEGGAQVTTPKSRYLTTAISVALASSAASPDGDRFRDRAHGGGDAGGGAVSGASGFKAVGMVLGYAAHSRVVNSAMAGYGAAWSVYSHFLARGRDVVYPKNMSMIIGLGKINSPSAASTN